MKRHLKLAVAGVVAVGIVGMASASLITAPALRLNDGFGNIVIVGDGDTLDLNAIAGVVTYVGSVGPNWYLNVTTGLGMPDSGSPSSLSMDLNSVNSSKGSGTLEIDFWDNGYFQAGDQFSFVSEVGGTTDGTVTFKTYEESPNSSFGHAQLLTSMGPLGSGAFSGTTSGGPLWANYTGLGFTLEAIITHEGEGTTSFNYLTKASSVPDGGMTLSMLGLALAGVAAVRRFIR